MRRLLAIALLLATAPEIVADVETTLPDGRRVVLRDDFTWSYLDEGGTPAADELMRLEVEARREGARSCVFGLRLTNEAEYDLRSLVPQISAYTPGDTRYETVFAAFSSIKPTRSQYREVRFSGIACKDIAYLRVSGGDRCEMGDLTKFDPVKGVCLQRVRIAPSEIVDIAK